MPSCTHILYTVFHLNENQWKTPPALFVLTGAPGLTNGHGASILALAARGRHCAENQADLHELDCALLASESPLLPPIFLLISISLLPSGSTSRRFKLLWTMVISEWLPQWSDQQKRWEPLGISETGLLEHRASHKVCGPPCARRRSL